MIKSFNKVKKINLQIISFFVIFTLFISFGFLSQVNADSCDPCAGNVTCLSAGGDELFCENLPEPEPYCDPEVSTCTEDQTIIDQTEKDTGRKVDISLKNPLTSIGSKGGSGDISVLIGLIIKSLMGFIGAIVLLFFVIGAFTWLTSRGNSEKVMEGAKTMAFAFIGALVVFTSYMLTDLIISVITGIKQ